MKITKKKVKEMAEKDEILMRFRRNLDVFFSQVFEKS